MYKMLMEGVSDIVIVIGEDSKVIYVNQAACHWIGDLIGASLKSLQTMDGLSSLNALMTRHLGSDGRLPREECIITKDGKIIVLDIKSMRLHEGDVPKGTAFFGRNVTDQRTAQVAFQSSEEKFRIFSQGLSHAVHLIQEVDGVYRYVYVNPAFTRNTGYSLEDLKDKTFFDIIHPDFHPIVIERAKARLRGEQAERSYELKVIKKDGQEMWSSFHASVIEYKGRPAILGSAHDITEIKVAEEKLRKALEALKESERMFVGIINSLPYATFVIDRAGVVIAWNRSIEIITGVKADEMLGKGNYEYAIPFYKKRQPILADMALDPEKINPDLYAVIERRNNLISGNGYIEDLNGREFYFSATATTLHDLKGDVAGAIESMIDTTELRRAEKALQQSEEKFRALTEKSPDIIMMFDQELRHQYTNPAIQKYMRMTPESFIGKTHSELGFPREMAVAAENAIRNVFRTKEQGRVELVNPTGQCFDWMLSPVFSRDGEVESVITSARDISDYKKTKEALARAEKMEAIGTLAGGIAHDFNNLLQGIMGYASLMKLDNDPDSQNYLRAQLITDASLSAGDLTRQLLGFARGGRYNVEVLNLNDVITKSATMFGRTKKEIVIHYAFQPEVWTIEADRVQMEQVLLNLYVNAWQAMPGGGELFLQTSNLTVDEKAALAHHTDPGNYVKISVTDSGVGMDEKTASRIFEPFFTTKAMGRGTGLGLASAYGIIKGHGGFINVYSEKGHGTTFNIYLPASMKEVRILEEKKSALPGGKETILLVDDELHVLKVAEEMIKSLGYTVMKATGGKEAIEIYLEKKDRIDLVILDMIMPQMGGREVFLALKKINPVIKTILSSGYTLNGQAREIMDMGVSSFIQKPYAVEDMAVKIREVLDN